MNSPKPEKHCFKEKGPSVGHLLEDILWGEHGTVNLQNLLLLDEVLPPGLQDVVLQGTAHRAKVIETTHT